MTSAVLVSIADCVATDFGNAYGNALISQPITIARTYAPKFAPADQAIGVYQVFISADKEQAKRMDRGNIEVEYSIEVGVCCRLPDQSNATVDPAMLLIQQMADFFFDNDLSNGAGKWFENEVYFWGDKDRLNFDNSFFALWDMKFKGARSKTWG